MVTNKLEKLVEKQTVKLTIPLVASYLARGIKRTKIADLCNISAQAVYDYCARHYNELAPLIDSTDGVMAIQAKHIANKAQERLCLHLNETEKKDLFALNAISGTHIDKYRLLSDKSTQNVSMQTIQANKEDRESRRRELQEARARVLELSGEGEKDV